MTNSREDVELEQLVLDQFAKIPNVCPSNPSDHALMWEKDTQVVWEYKKDKECWTNIGTKTEDEFDKYIEQQKLRLGL